MPASDSPYAGAAAIAAAERLLRETEQDPMPREAETDHQVLALTVNVMNAASVAIVDFGGGVGQSYAALRRMVAPRIGLRYRVVELEPLVARGREIWDGHGEIEFSSDRDLGDFAPSIVFAKGVIQYFADYSAILRGWFSIGAPWVLLEKLPVVSSPSYVTMQVDVYGAAVPYWMIDAGHLEDVARASGYRIALQRRLERVYDQSDFPPELRMERATTLLFERHP
jgi:putative methyltransferase (TIGR04325 family)